MSAQATYSDEHLNKLIYLEERGVYSWRMANGETISIYKATFEHLSNFIKKFKDKLPPVKKELSESELDKHLDYLSFKDEWIYKD